MRPTVHPWFLAGLALLGACSGPGTSSPDGGGTGGGGAAVVGFDAAQSALTVDRADGVRADGVDAVAVTVTLRGSDGRALVDAEVALGATGTGNRLAATVRTDAQGVARAQLTSTRAEEKRLSATVQAASGAVPLSQTPTVRFVSGPASRLRFQVSPASTPAGQPLTPAAQVAVEDGQGNPVTAAAVISLALDGGLPGARLDGIVARSSAGGVAEFSGVSVSLPARGAVLLATSPGLTPATSAPFDVTSGAAARLRFAVSPAGGVAGEPITPPVVVAVEDSQGLPVLEPVQVGLSLGNNPTGAALSGASAVADGGAAVFSGLAVDRPGVGYTLQAASAGLPSVVSAPFAVSSGPAVALRIAEQPTSGVAGTALAPALAVEAVDGRGFLVSGPTAISLRLESDAGLTLRGALTAATDAGRATFSPVFIDFTGTHTLVASSGDAGARTAPIVIGPGAVDPLRSSVDAAPLRLVADGMARTTLTVTLRDGFLNPVPGVSVALAATAPDGGVTLTQPTLPSDAAGVTTGSATCARAQDVRFVALLDGGAATPPVTVTFTECAPGAMATCYPGPAGTVGVGPCTAGTKTCGSTGAWGPCLDAVLPGDDLCGNNVDEDCDGTADNPPDQDGDGWSACQGDCCETAAQCSVPRAVNPGAIEALSNGVDDDCDSSTSDTTAPPACSPAAKLTGVTAADFAQAMDLCQTTTANPPLPTKKWGLVSASQLAANGTVFNATQLTSVQNFQTAVKTRFGSVIAPRQGLTFGVLSTGRARDSADTGFVSPIDGTDFGRVIAFPGAGPLAQYLTAHGGALLPGHCGAASCLTGTGAYDSVLIRLVVRVPTNAQGFSFDFKFHSAEYQTYQCTVYNDYFLALVTSQAAGLPADKQVSFDALGNTISVNNGFFQECGGNGKACGACPSGTGPLAGTGLTSPVNGGATTWLTTDVPVVPGETITLEFALFDVSDGILDTTVLFDKFRWSLTPVTLGTHQ